MDTNSTPTREQLRATLDRFKVTHLTAAEAIGVGRSTVSLWLQGEVSSPALDKAIPAFVRGLEIGSSKAA